MMKIKDVQSATALIIQGYLRSNDEVPANSAKLLFDCLSGIRQEVGDWAENLPIPAGKDGNALEPADIEVGLVIRGADVPRSPYNLVSAAIELLREAVDLSGPEEIGRDFDRRQVFIPVAVRAPLKIEDAIYEASRLAKEIDAETETRPAEKIARWETLCADLRDRGVAVEDRVVCPANW